MVKLPRSGQGDPPVDDWLDNEDDWLAEQGELDWLHESRPRNGGDVWATSEDVDDRTRVRRGLLRPGVEGDHGLPPDRATLVRRRRLAALGAAGVALIVIIVAFTAFGGGGRKKPTTVANTQPASTQPAGSTPTHTTPPRTTPASTQTAPPKTALRVTVPAGGSLRKGDTGPKVVTLQKALAKLGFAVGKPDGSFGDATEAAVIDFQKSNGLTPDGVVGAKTADKINAALARLG